MLQHPDVAPHITESMGQGRRYMVWGSSSGSLVLYASLAYGWSCVGVELLHCLSARAQQCLREVTHELVAAGAGEW